MIAKEGMDGKQAVESREPHAQHVGGFVLLDRGFVHDKSLLRHLM